MSIKSIAATLGVSVSSVSVWARGIELTEEQKARLMARHRGSATMKWMERHRSNREAAQLHGRQMARRGDPLHLMGTMLYWAEGSKQANAVVFTNAEVEMHRLFLRFLGECYEVADARICLTVNCFLNNGLGLEEIEGWWLRQLDLPPTALRKATVNHASSASRFKRPPLRYGTVRLVVHSTFIVQSIYGAIQEYGGFERPEWVETHRARRAAAA